MDKFMIKIKTKIDKHPIRGLDQEVEIAQVAYMDFDIQEAKKKFRLYALDKDVNSINSNSTTYKVWEHFSNSGVLTKECRTINEENFPIEEGEEQEAYQNRIDKIKENRIP